jgi:hypothetical protein
MNKETQFFQFLEKKKENLYKIENKGTQYKTTTAQLKLLKEIYEFWNFNFLKVAYLRPNEKEKWNSYMKILKNIPNEEEREKKRFVGMKSLNVLKVVYNRLKNYDILKVGNQSYVIK